MAGRRQRSRRGSAHRRWFGIGAFATTILTALLVLTIDVPAYPALIIGTSVVLFSLYDFDKQRAIGGGGRVPEPVMHGLALAGGFIGGWTGRALFRHKPRHLSFLVMLVLSTAIHIVIAVRMYR